MTPLIEIKSENKHPADIASEPGECAVSCSSASAIEDLNRACFCISVDKQALHSAFEALLAGHQLPTAMADSHPHLFAALPVFVSRRHLEQLASVVAAIDEVTQLPGYREAVMAWAPAIAGFDPGSPGGLLGLDFHLGDDGPRLIEVNTNPGGVLLNALMGQAVTACTPGFTVPPEDAGRVEDAVLQVMLDEWRAQRGDAPLGLVAIVDDTPAQQYLYPEFVLFRNLFREHGIRAEICSPEMLVRRQGRLWLDDAPVDLVYNRLTDFALEEPAHAALRDAYLAGSVVLSPHPRAHAIHADKRNLVVLGDRDSLRRAGASAPSIDVLAAAIPRTRILTPANREQMWADRRHLFFKPAAGFGSRASYRGDKLTRRVWDEIGAGTYVAQAFVPPGERRLAPGVDGLKVDIRCYAYQGQVLLHAARMYRGQTTNFRTAGGGFAPVLTTAAAGLVGPEESPGAIAPVDAFR